MDTQPNITVVDGLEMRAILRPPSGVQCDGCKVVIHPDISRWRDKRTLVTVDIRTAAWLDFGWSSGAGERDYCPVCSKLREADGRLRRSKKAEDIIIVDEIIGTNAYIDGKLQPKREGATYIVKALK